VAYIISVNTIMSRTLLRTEKDIAMSQLLEKLQHRT
jgi:hypothetical protein